jgi:hypothetical protein
MIDLFLFVLIAILTRAGASYLLTVVCRRFTRVFTLGVLSRAAAPPCEGLLKKE